MLANASVEILRVGFNISSKAKATLPGVSVTCGSFTSGINTLSKGELAALGVAYQLLLLMASPLNVGIKLKYWVFRLSTNSVIIALVPSSNEYRSNCPPGELSKPSDAAGDAEVAAKEAMEPPKTVISTSETVLLCPASGVNLIIISALVNKAMLKVWLMSSMPGVPLEVPKPLPLVILIFLTSTGNPIASNSL